MHYVGDFPNYAKNFTYHAGIMRFMLSSPYYAKNYAGIIDTGLLNTLLINYGCLKTKHKSYVMRRYNSQQLLQYLDIYTVNNTS